MEMIARREIEFWLYDWLQVDRLATLPRFEGQTREDWDAVLDLAERMAASDFLPCNKIADREEPSLDQDGEVRVQPDLRDAMRTWLASGLQLATVDAERGGMQLPVAVASVALAKMMAANVSASAFMMLTIANARVISDSGTPAQVDHFAAPQHEGTSLGTMCLSEPDVGSSLGDITTRATFETDDAIGARYRLAGRKMWISGGGQDVTAQNVHLVLAKIADPDGSLPTGTKGISLFIVPRVLPAALDGARNDVVVAGLNHKMGYRGIPNCLINFGEGTHHRPLGTAGAVGWLLGEPGQGLAIMFQMMNEARINVGLGAASLAWRGYVLSCEYAAERVQGRPLEDRKAPRPVPLLRHPDVRRMLLAQRAIGAGSLALCLYAARLADVARGATDAAERSRAHALLDLLTPIVKSWPSEQGLLANHHAIQVHGGYGYTRDFDVEQLYRDNRLNPIHEGTTGIQGIDLLGRKVLGDGGAGFAGLRAEIEATAARAAAAPALGAMAAALRDAAGEVAGVVDAAIARDDRAVVLADATAFLEAMGHLVVGWLWLDMTLAAGGQDVDPAQAEATTWTCRHYYAAEMPRIAGMLAPLKAGGLTREVPEAMFQPA
ncbi:acyl-CoA dehydrogenase [Acuticoccus sp. I52.16.1]|uniref:acyl-CoA dehydrogenase n=1 Tax=Acuticoccus sp. I52.16.1 TaxID=2928472 RepID=UPI001FD0BB39|nr:acyl-CoA dehydrogenase [Acuticoccus sp. I52.16.1]UOM33135.1 acyl-CoA dehydrogenase [Acuticoccus sp. I52.16.1]